ncbi:MAG: hypothetical protein ACT4O2_12125 [Beijerinckiaceae bacterium]
MESISTSTLREIGVQLDQGLYLKVRNGGLVEPSRAGIPTTELGEVQYDGQIERSRGPAAKSWGRAPGREGKAGGCGAAGQTASVIVPAIRSRYEAELDAVQEAYPGAQMWHQGLGFWMLTESRLLSGLDRRAAFLTVVAFEELAARGWGYWQGSALSTPAWIGPRHTNYPDGSICAFTPSDGIWRFGDSLIALLDLYSVWAVRHLHLQIFGRWPGLQFVPERFERIVELHEDELCGCSQSTGTYGQCCRPMDLVNCTLADGVQYQLRLGVRQPPSVVSQFMVEGGAPPRIETIFGPG